MEYYSKAYHLFGRIQQGYYKWRLQGMLEGIRRFDKDEAANQRMKIIRFYEEYG